MTATTTIDDGNVTLPMVRIIGFVLPPVAAILTGFRLWDRTRSGRLWWDDGWAFISMILALAFTCSTAIYLDNPKNHSQATKVGFYYSCSALFYAVIWSARVSILFTIIRLQYGRIRVILACVAGLFGVTWAILTAQFLWVCERNPEWKKNFAPQCALGLDVALAQLITTVLCDLTLVFAPVFMVYKSSGLTRPKKIRLIALFSTTIITTIVSLNHAYLILKRGGIREGLAAIIEASVSLIVANLSVIIAFFFRITTEEEEVDYRNPFEGGTAPIFTNLSTLFGRGRQWPVLPVTSTFMTTDGRVRQAPGHGHESDKPPSSLGGETQSRGAPATTFSIFTSAETRSTHST